MSPSDALVATPVAPVADAPTSASSGGATIRIPVTGMTCAACQSRVQRTLQKTPGVSDAAVNLMMNSATVSYDPAAVAPQQLVDAIRETGYGAALASPGQTAFQEQEARDQAQDVEFADLRRKAIVSGVIGAVLMVVSMRLMSGPGAWALLVTTLGVMCWAGRV